MAGKIRVEGRELALPEGDDLTYGELIAMERISGLTQSEMKDQAARGSIRALAALVYIAMKRAGDDVTEDTVLNMRIAQTEIVADEGQESDDPPASGGAESSSAASNEPSQPEAPGTPS